METKNGNAMFEIIVTLGLAAFAIWLLLDSAIEYVRDGALCESLTLFNDSAVEYIRDGQEDTLATEP